MQRTCGGALRYLEGDLRTFDWDRLSSPRRRRRRGGDSALMATVPVTIGGSARWATVALALALITIALPPAIRAVAVHPEARPRQWQYRSTRIASRA
jgi:hypothetical protein